MKKLLLILLLIYAHNVYSLILGYNVTTGSTYNAISGVSDTHGRKIISPYNATPSASGTATKLWIFTNTSCSITNKIKLGLYNGISVGSTLLASGELINAPRGQWNSVSINVPVTAGVPLYIASMEGVGHGITFKTTGGTFNQELPINENVYTNEMVSTLDRSNQSYTGIICMYVEYEEGTTPSHSLTITNDTHGTTNPTGTSTVTSGENISISATPASGYQFVNWTVTSGSATFANSNLTSTTVAITSDATIRANFELIPVYTGKILCIGNSNTYGYPDATLGGYRKPLQDLLGVGVYDFVGQYTDGPTGYDNNHSGHSGDVISQISSRLSTSLTSYMSNAGSESYVLMLAGTNNVNGDGNTDNYPTYISQYEAMIDAVVAYNPNITFIAALLPPAELTSTNTHITYFNGLLTTMINNKKLTNTHLRLVDLNTPIISTSNWQGTLYYDNLHPNSAGHAVIAQAWYGAILNTQPPTQFTLNTSVSGSGSISVSPEGSTFDSGTVLTLTANPSVGYDFTAWSGDLSGSTNPITLTLNSNKSVAATFTQQQTGTPPTITSEPSNTTVYTGNTATFTVSATGTAPLTYKWIRGTDSVGNAATLSLSSVTIGMNGYQYRCVVKNGYGENTSAVATLTVTARVLTSISVYPSSTKVLMSSQKQFSAVAYDQTGLALDIQPEFTWSDNSASSSINSQGLLTTGEVEEAFTITATSSSISGSGSIRVVEKLGEVERTAFKRTYTGGFRGAFK